MARTFDVPSGSQLAGTPTNDAAAAGNVGEEIISTIASGSAVVLTSTVAANVTSIVLTPGDWDISAHLAFTGGATTTITNLSGGISTTTGTLPTIAGGINYASIGYNSEAGFNVGGAVETVALPPSRVSIAANTTYFLVASSQFATSTCSAFGTLRARRVR